MLTGIVCLVVASSPAAVTPSCALDVRVVMDDGRPGPPGLLVRAISGQGVVQQTALSDSGSVSLAKLPCGTLRVATGQLCSGTWRPIKETAVTLAPGLATVAGFSVPRLVPILVSVVDDDNSPARGGYLSVRLLPGSEPPNAFDGTLSIECGAGGANEWFLQPGGYSLHLYTASQVVSVSIDGTKVDEPVLINVSNAPVQVNYVVRRGVVLQGRIIDSEGRGVESAQVTATFPGAQELALLDQASTRADGFFQLTVPQLPVEVIPSGPDPGSRWTFSPFSSVVQNDTGELLTFLASQDAAALRGQLTDKRTGQAVSGDVGVEVDCYSAQASAVQQVKDGGAWGVSTSADGAFSTRCPRWCPFKVSAVAEGYLSETVDRSPGECQPDLVFELRRGAVVTGTITDATGAPVAELPIRLGSLRSRTASDGGFTLTGVGSKEYTLVVDGVGKPTKAQRTLLLVPKRAPQDSRGPVVVSGLAPDKELHLEVEALEQGIVCLQTIDERGAAASIGELSVYSVDGDRPLASRLVGRVPGPSRGVLCVDQVPPGERRVHAMGGDIVAVWWPGETDAQHAGTITVRAGKRTEIGPIVVRFAGTIEVQLSGWDSKGGERPLIELLRVGDADSATSDWEGLSDDRLRPGEKPSDVSTWIVSAVPAGIWRVRACRGHASHCESASEMWEAAKAAEVVRGGTALIPLLRRDD